jgi:putative Mg2+ transporter-C (MgtC) family protein
MWLQQFDHSVQVWAAGLGTTGEAMLRLLLAAIAGGLIGLERELRGRQAGFRTNLLVCLGSAMTMIVSLEFGRHIWTPQATGVNINVDPARIAYGVMTGVGFLGAGAIIRTQGSIRGLTTAAALWCVAAIGMALGFGMYVLAIATTGMVLLAVWLLAWFEDWLPRTRYRTVTVRRKWSADCINETVRHFQDARLDVVDASFQRSEDLEWADINLQIAFINRDQYYTFERRLEGDGTYLLMSTKEL